MHTHTWALHRISNNGCGYALRHAHIGPCIQAIHELHVWTQVYTDTHNHPDSHMTNRANLLYNIGMHIDISLHMAMHTPHMDDTQDLPHEQVCILVTGG